MMKKNITAALTAVLMIFCIFIAGCSVVSRSAAIRLIQRSFDKRIAHIIRQRRQNHAVGIFVPAVVQQLHLTLPDTESTPRQRLLAGVEKSGMGEHIVGPALLDAVFRLCQGEFVFVHGCAVRSAFA